MYVENSDNCSIQIQYIVRRVLMCLALILLSLFFMMQVRRWTSSWGRSSNLETPCIKEFFSASHDPQSLKCKDARTNGGWTSVRFGRWKIFRLRASVRGWTSSALFLENSSPFFRIKGGGFWKKLGNGIDHGAGGDRCVGDSMAPVEHINYEAISINEKWKLWKEMEDRSRM